MKEYQNKQTAETFTASIYLGNGFWSGTVTELGKVNHTSLDNTELNLHWNLVTVMRKTKEVTSQKDKNKQRQAHNESVKHSYRIK